MSLDALLDQWWWILVRTGAKYLVAATILVLVFGGCGGGNRFISSQGGRVESGELDLSGIPVRSEPTEYVIGQGDELEILFLYNSDFNQPDLKVRPDGKISLAYVGDVEAAGKPVSVLDSLLTARFSEIIIDPDITVIVRKYRPEVVYALGEVGNPGGYEYQTGMTLTTCLALSGGPSKVGRRSEILVMRRIAPDHIVGIQIDLNELLGKKRFDLDIPLEPFDIVYVPKARLESARDFTVAMKEIISAPAEIYLKGWEIANVKVLYDYYRRSRIYY
jgi:polysaccharide export outer membrane protein